MFYFTITDFPESSLTGLHHVNIIICPENQVAAEIESPTRFNQIEGT